MANINKTVRIGTVPDYAGRAMNVFCKIKYANGKLSVTGVEGPMPNGDARGSCGQTVMHLREAVDTITPAPGWDGDKLQTFFAVWDEWCLNDMSPNCEHQVGPDWTSRDVEVITCGLTSEGFALRKKALAESERAAIAGEVAQLNATGRALLTGAWFKNLHEAPDADSPLSGLFEVKKREIKKTGRLNESEHPAGFLSKACPVCGHKYGSAWKKREVPADVLEFLRSLPDTDITLAWV